MSYSSPTKKRRHPWFPLTLFSIALVALSSFSGCATSIKKIGYFSDGQVRNGLLKMTPLGSSPEETLIVISKRIKNDTEIISPNATWTSRAEKTAGYRLHAIRTSTGHSPRSGGIEVFLGEYPAYYMIIPGGDQVTANWIFSDDGRLVDIVVTHAVVSF